MTVKELKEKLSKYTDDTEIMVGNYDDLHGILTYNDPYISQEEINVCMTKKGHIIYERFGNFKRLAKATILVIE